MSAHAPREAAQERHSAETRISLSLNLDGEGKTRIDRIDTITGFRKSPQRLQSHFPAPTTNNMTEHSEC